MNAKHTSFGVKNWQYVKEIDQQKVCQKGGSWRRLKIDRARNLAANSG
jgi:hypothetical protein